ncbi:hypothetical protein [Paraburkholderia sp. Cpub6]|uniref:hypothetical protein n=1 Tax=Paraburkholderia sp. Cpub6 TaxID=2723094 RepID=UPI0016216134|nr:hypothetical protein [Paraburkholderia sp. Cpub6]MBB5458771.1 hypothetical protein [Paraburkholderia sp. Cpub6]
MGGLAGNSLKSAIKLTTISTGSTVSPPIIAPVPQSPLWKAYSNLRFGSTRNQIVIGAPPLPTKLEMRVENANAGNARGTAFRGIAICGKIFSPVSAGLRAAGHA